MTSGLHDLCQGLGDFPHEVTADGQFAPPIIRELAVYPPLGLGYPFGPAIAQGKNGNTTFKKENTHMLWTIFVILMVLWALGLVTAYTMGGLIHVLLVVALVVLAIQLIQGRRVA
jgi:hypothetical protein